MVDNDPYLAALRAGINPQTAKFVGEKYCADPAVLAYLKQRRAALLNPQSLSRDELMSALLRTLELAGEAQNPVAMLQTLREAGHMSGIKPKEKSVDLTGSQAEIMKSLTSMTDKELLELMEKGPAKLKGE